jgi:hypothetical protein
MVDECVGRRIIDLDRANRMGREKLYEAAVPFGAITASCYFEPANV